jgi:hypothetical protein
MIFAIPIVGKVLAGLAASEASASPAETQKINRLKLAASHGGAVTAGAFGQALDKLDSAAGSKNPFATTAKS